MSNKKKGLKDTDENLAFITTLTEIANKIIELYEKHEKINVIKVISYFFQKLIFVFS